MPEAIFDHLTTDLAAMRRYARSLARDEAVADDIVQDALLRALERKDTFRPGASPRSWLLAIVHNVFISGMRKLTAETQRNEQFAKTLIERGEPEQEHAAVLAQVARSFAALPDRQREVLHLIAVEDLSYHEASQVLKVPIGTVMSRLSRARAALRQVEKQRPPGVNRLRIAGRNDDR